jgi:hypothetical protein
LESAVPSELRQLLFRPAEVVQAVKEYHRRLGTPLPSGTVTRCGPECEVAGGIVSFRIAIVSDSDSGGSAAVTEDTRQDIVIEGPSLAAALILYCRDRRIPLPAGADKSLQRVGEKVCLIATINPNQDELPEQLRL